MSTDARAARASTLTTPSLRCSGVSVSYGAEEVLHRIDLDVQPGQLVALLGASGSGKSTLLHAIAGLVAPSHGEISLAGHLVSGRRHVVPPEERDVGMVFQSFALWPHMRIVDTVAYPLRRAGHSRDAARDAALGLLDRLGIAHLADERPARLSGGEQQRVGLARALARNARVYLLDEPTAHLDTTLRSAFQEAVVARRDELGAAIVYATHDAAEALALADRVVVMERGRVVQVDEPLTVYAEPASAAVAELTGPCSVLTAEVRRCEDGLLEVELGSQAAVATGGGSAGTTPRTAAVMVRPEWVAAGGPMSGVVTAAAFRGPHTDYRLMSSGQLVALRSPGPPRWAVGSTMSWTLSQVWVLPADQPSATIAPG